MADGCKGMAVAVTASVMEVPFPHELEGVTTTLPDVVPLVTVMLLFPCPAVMLHPEGTVQA
jgi:hypothetical protein